MRVGFLFNHYATHQVAHAAPYAFELSRRHPEIEIVVACASRAEEEAVRRIAGLYPGARVQHRRLRVPWFHRAIDPVVSHWSFRRKGVVLRHNVDFFAELDVLVAPEHYCLRLRAEPRLRHLRYVHTCHGAGDREGGSMDDQSQDFDLTLLPGRKYLDWLHSYGEPKPGSYAVVGYPKFDVVGKAAMPARRWFKDDKPIVLYNPHFEANVSSWQTQGVSVLDYFADQRDYNLVFAPHVVLFMRRARHRALLPRRFRRLPNVHVDLGSDASNDMTYTQAADIYLGDASSQVYEFLLRPRPCIFLNAHGVDWRDQPSHRHWHLGQVIEDVGSELGPALTRAPAVQRDFLPRQREAFAYTFYEDAASTAAERGADAIAAFLRNSQ